MNIKNTRVVLFVMLPLIVGAAHAGVYTGTAVCSASADCSPATILSDPKENDVPPFAITHPFGYKSEDVFASSFETGDTSDWSSVALGE